MKAVRLPPPRSLEPREVPAYRISEVAQYLGMPKATVRAWALGQGDFKPVLRLEAVFGSTGVGLRRACRGRLGDPVDDSMRRLPPPPPRG